MIMVKQIQIILDIQDHPFLCQDSRWVRRLSDPNILLPNLVSNELTQENAIFNFQRIYGISMALASLPTSVVFYGTLVGKYTSPMDHM